MNIRGIDHGRASHAIDTPRPERYVERMSVRVTVRGGRMIVDEPTDLPEGVVLDLVIDDEGDDLDPAERRALDEAISRSLEDGRAGRSAPADHVLDRLRARRAR